MAQHHILNIDDLSGIFTHIWASSSSEHKRLEIIIIVFARESCDFQGSLFYKVTQSEVEKYYGHSLLDATNIYNNLW